MIPVRALANSISQVVNPNEVVTVKISTGFTVGAGAKQVPTYAAPVSGPAQIQALDEKDLKQLDSLNIQGVVRKIYLFGPLAGVVRPNQTGGDLILRTGQFTGTWLVVKVLETWPEWTAAAIVLQGPP